MLRIMAVCTGNVCRSPLTEALLRVRLAGFDVDVSSTGVGALTGEPMTVEARELAIAHGADPDSAASHRAVQLDERALEGIDLVLTMTREHRARTVDLAPAKLKTVFTLREFARLAGATPDNELNEVAAVARGSRERMRLIRDHLAALRGVVGPPASPTDDDVPDPYRRGTEAYERSAALIVPAVDEAARAVRAAARPR